MYERSIFATPSTYFFALPSSIIAIYVASMKRWTQDLILV